MKEQGVLQTLLSELIAHWENEVVEFKNVGDSFSTIQIAGCGFRNAEFINTKTRAVQLLNVS